jgi:hypothetical protein
MTTAVSVIFAVVFALVVPLLAAAQTDFDKAQNLATCLSGRYPTLCKKHWLSSEELKKTEDAERQENLKTCLTGRYPSLCDKSLLSETELKQVLDAEKSENLRTCLTGRYPSLCDKSLLTNEQLSQTQAAEKKAVDSRRQYSGRGTVPRGRRYPSSGCEAGHWVEYVSSDGQIVKLEDGSIWEVDAVDAIDSALWLPTTEIVVCDDKLINTDDNETVSATRIR